MRLPRLSVPALLACGLVCGGMAALSGCAAVTAVFSGDADSGSEQEVRGDISPSVLALGDCLNAVSGSLLAGIDGVPCTDNHDWEVYFQIQVSAAADGSFPGAAVIVAAAEEACAAEFPEFLGLGSGLGTDDTAEDATAAFGYTYLTPLESEWSENDSHLVSCLIGDMNGQVTGSLAGAGASATAAG
ncbi:MAG: septum formation family protein [Cryobacterium sp.]